MILYDPIFVETLHLFLFLFDDLLHLLRLLSHSLSSSYPFPYFVDLTDQCLLLLDAHDGDALLLRLGIRLLILLSLLVSDRLQSSLDIVQELMLARRGLDHPDATRGIIAIFMRCFVFIGRVLAKLLTHRIIFKGFIDDDSRCIFAFKTLVFVTNTMLLLEIFMQYVADHLLI